MALEMIAWSSKGARRVCGGLRWPCVLLLLSGCARQTIPEPGSAVRAYSEAARKGDSQAIYDMLSERSRRDLRAADVARIVRDERRELSDQAAAITDPHAIVRATARVRYDDGEEVSLDIEDGTCRIGSVDGLPGQARSPVQALEQFRKALARRSYAGLIRVLSPATRSAIEGDLRSLAEGLSHPEGLDVQVVGDVAQVRLGDGHLVRLRRERGLWTVEDFD